MTERLSALLHSEASALDVPPVDHAAILGRGQQTRTRRRATGLLAAAAVVAVVGTGAVLAVDDADNTGRDGQASDSITTDGPSRGLVAYGAGSTVVIDGATARIPDTLHSLSYTSVGVLTRSNVNGGSSDGSGPEFLTLIAPDGTTTSVGTIPEGVGPATDPDEPVYALAEKSGDGFRVVIRDALSGDEVGSVPLPDLPMSYWPVPPLSLDGDIVYAGFKQAAMAFNWRTGEMQRVAGLGGGLPEVRGGHTVSEGDGVYSVVDAASGYPLLDIDLAEGDYASGVLSPDGRYLRFSVDPMLGSGDAPGGLDVYDVATGERVRLPGAISDWGWTSGSMIFRVTGKGLEVCNPVSGACDTESAPRIGENLRLGGNTYES